MHPIVLAIKVDVDTDRGTRIGVPNLLALFAEHGIDATFLFSLGPDNTGRALRRIFRRGFLRKVLRTRVASVYGWRTLLNGVLWPGPHIGRRNSDVMRRVKAAGHEVGIHCYDHIYWQDKLHSMTRQEVFAEFGRAQQEFLRIFGVAPRTAGAAGWQASGYSLAAYDAAGLDYASDVRGDSAFLPALGETVFNTPQIPTTLPTLDELLGRAEYPEERLTDHYFSLLRKDRPNVLTIHAELEGMVKLEWFGKFLTHLHGHGIRPISMAELAKQLLQQGAALPVCELRQGEVDGRAGFLATQGPPHAVSPA
jgi:peptidoglycan/xylan/chitin deacetylase (PgdA/CDA1 family)